jgi:hypothetical protein
MEEALEAVCCGGSSPLRSTKNIWVWCSTVLVCTPVLGTGSRRFKSYHSDFTPVAKLVNASVREAELMQVQLLSGVPNGSLAERICSRLLSGEIQV